MSQLFSLLQTTLALSLITVSACAPRPQQSAQSNTPLSAPPLGTAQAFAVLGGSTVTNTGATVISGDLGVDPGMAVTGFPPGLLLGGGTTHQGDAVALQAQSDLTALYGDLAGLPCNVDMTGQDLGGLTLSQGVYCFSSSAQLTGALTLDAAGDPAAVFVFQIGSTLTTASNASVSMINGGAGCNVFWQIGSSATLGTDTAFVGNIAALTSITLVTRASIAGSAWARNGAVTMDDNRLSTSCSAALDAGPPPAADASAAQPDAGLALADAQPISMDAEQAPADAALSREDAGFAPDAMASGGQDAAHLGDCD